MGKLYRGAAYVLGLCFFVQFLGTTLAREVIIRYLLFRLGKRSIKGFLIALFLAYLCYCPHPARILTEYAGCPNPDGYDNYGSSRSYFYDAYSNSSSGARPLVTGKGYAWGYRTVGGGHVALAMGIKIKCNYRPRFNEQFAIYVIMYNLHQRVRNAYCSITGCQYGKYYFEDPQNYENTVNSRNRYADVGVERAEGGEEEKTNTTTEDQTKFGHQLPFKFYARDIDIPFPIMWEVIDIYFGYRVAIRTK